MKKILLLLLILFTGIAAYSQTTDTSYTINKIAPTQYGKYAYLTNADPIIFGTDTIAAGGISIRIVYGVNYNTSALDTNYTANKYKPLSYGKYTDIINNYSWIFGNDTLPAGSFTGEMVYILNPPETAPTDEMNGNDSLQLKVNDETIINITTTSVVSRKPILYGSYPVCVWRGALEGEPNTDLEAGQIYFNTNENKLFIFDGSIWQSCFTP